MHTHSETANGSYFLCKNSFGDDGSQNLLVYQPRFHNLELKKYDA